MSERTRRDVLKATVGALSASGVTAADGKVGDSVNGWGIVVNDGPAGRSRTSTAIDVTDDGQAIWFVGGSGVIGEYNVVTETLTDYSAPMGKTSTWEGVAVTGETGTNERVYFVNGSGEELSGQRQPDGRIAYEEVTKPGGGSTIPYANSKTPSAPSDRTGENGSENRPDDRSTHEPSSCARRTP